MMNQQHTRRHAPRKRGIQYSGAEAINIGVATEYWIARFRGR